MTLSVSDPASTRPPSWILLAGLAIAYSPTYLNRLARGLGADWEWLKGPPSVLVWNWLVVATLLAFIFKVERRSLGSIGLKKPSIQDVLWAITFWLIATAASGMVSAWLPPAPSDGAKTILALSLSILVLLIFTTSITEEILFRGYAVERLPELTGQLRIAVAMSAALFVLPHIVFFGPH